MDVQKIRNDAVQFAVDIANNNSHGYSQQVRSLYNMSNPKSFDCSSLVCTAYQYALEKNGITPTPQSCGCSYTGNMLNLLKCGFEIVATNQTAHAQMIKGDIELNTIHHTAMAIDSNNIVHARSSEGTTDTIDNSGNEIRTQPWYNYSKGWTHRLRFTGNGLSGGTNSTGGSSNSNPSSSTRNWLQQGDKGAEVKTMQLMLIACGYSCGSCGADGDFGSATRLAVIRFQGDVGITQDGAYGVISKSKLIAKHNAISTNSSSGSRPIYTVNKTYTTLVDCLNVRTGSGTGYAKKSKSQLTSDGKKHSNSSGQLYKGTKVTCLRVDNIGNDIWVKTPSGFLAAYYNGKKYVG